MNTQGRDKCPKVNGREVSPKVPAGAAMLGRDGPTRLTHVAGE